MNSPAVHEAKKKRMRLPPEETLELRHSVEVSCSHFRSFCGKIIYFCVARRCPFKLLFIEFGPWKALKNVKMTKKRLLFKSY